MTTSGSRPNLEQAMADNAKAEAERTFAQDIEEAADGEPIEAIVIGPFGWESDLDKPDEDAYTFEYYGHAPRTPIPQSKKGIVLSWEEARPWLDYKYDRGYGSPDCHNIYAWTKNRVLFIHEYDGATSVAWAPRNPPNTRSSLRLFGL